MKKHLFNFKNLLLFGLFALIGTFNAFGMINDQKLVTVSKKLFNHITTYEKRGNDNDPFIKGFHYYQAKPIKLFNGYYLSAIDKDCWVISPTDPSKVHYGYILYKGKLIKKPKTFFPSSLTEENLKETLVAIVAYAKNELSTRLKKNISGQLSVYLPSLRSKMTVKFNQKNKITSIFPCLDDMPLDQIVDKDWFMDWLKCMRQQQAYPDSLQRILVTAAERGCTEAVQHILACGAKVNPSNEYDDTALIAAIESGHIDTVIFLLKHGAKVDDKDSCRSTALHDAVNKGDIRIIRLLLNYGANINCVNGFGSTPLSYAVNNALISGKLDILELLLDAGADVNHRDNDGNTAFQSAMSPSCSSVGSSFLESCKCNGPAIIRFLLEHGADFAITNDKRESAYDIALRLNFDDALIKLLSPQPTSYACNIS